MGEIVSVYISKGFERVAFLKKERNRYRILLLDKGTGLLKEHIEEEPYITLLYTDMIQEVVDIPPVKDEETRELLIKKKLSERLGTQEDYLLVIREVEESPQTKSFRVFGIPKGALSEGSGIPESALVNSSLFTLTPFSLMGISKAVEGGLSIFHAYADESAITITVSQGEEVLYTRSILIPPYAGDDLTDFAYENLNMTYMFVAQRSNIPVDLVLLSGRLCQDAELVGSLGQFVSCPIAVPTSGAGFKGIDEISFHEYLPCLGAVLLKEDYDFSPRPLKDRRNFKRTLNKLIPLTALGAVLSLLLLAYEVYSLKVKQAEMEKIKDMVELQARSFFHNPLIREGGLEYFLRYARLIEKSRRENPLTLLEEVGPLISFDGTKLFALKRGKGAVNLYMEVEKSFESTLELTLFRERFFRRLEELKKRGISYRVEREEKDLNKNSLYLRLTLEKKV